MRDKAKTLVAVALALTGVLSLAACGGEAADPLNEQFAALEAEKAALDAKRAEYADLVAQAAAAAAAATDAEGTDEATAEGEEGAATAGEDLSGQVEQAKAEVAAMAEQFGTNIVGFLNADPMIEGEPINERQLAAIRMKSTEDMELAKEWISEGGDYKKAIQIYNQALVLDPDNDALKAALASAESERFMSLERFEAAQNGMTEAEIRAALGTPLHYNVRTYDDNGVTAWFYPTADNGAAAAVWFRPDDDGVAKVYQMKFEAVEGKAEEEEAA